MIVRRIFLAGTLLAMAMATPAFAAKAKDPVKVTSAKNIKGAQKVVIGQFTVGFMVERKDSAKAGGGLTGSGFGGRSTTRSALAGVGQPEFQAVADAAYEDFVAKLKAAGFEVGDRAALVAHPLYAKTKSEAAPKQMTTITGRDDKAEVLFISASQTAPLRLVAGDAAASGFGGMSMNMNGGQVMYGASDFAKVTGSHVINVVYYIDFANSEEYGGWFRNSSAVSVKGGLALIPDSSKLTVVGPNYKSGTLALAEPIAIGGDFFDMADTTSGGQKAGQTVANVIGFLGGVGTNSAKRLAFTARPETYVPGATQAAAAANATLIERLVALR